MLPIINLKVANVLVPNDKLLNHASIDGFKKKRPGIGIASKVWHDYNGDADGK